MNGGVCSFDSKVSQSIDFNQGCLRSSWYPSPCGLQPKRLKGSLSRSWTKDNHEACLCKNGKTNSLPSRLASQVDYISSQHLRATWVGLWKYYMWDRCWFALWMVCGQRWAHKRKPRATTNQCNTCIHVWREFWRYKVSLWYIIMQKVFHTPVPCMPWTPQRLSSVVLRSVRQC